jgi:sulfatase maturation enzyme AslB (radical SAM superfamily)
MLRVADAIVSVRPETVALTGGEPLVVPEVFELARRFTAAGSRVYLYTGGWPMKPAMVDDLAESCHKVIVSVDGATAEVHDQVRGRAGSFERAMTALALLDQGARERRERGAKPLNFGLDCVVLRSSFAQLELFCTDIVPRFPEMTELVFGAVVPTGLASRTGFAEHELLTDEQMAQMRDDAFLDRLQALAPSSVRVFCQDNIELQMNPAQIAAKAESEQIMVVEPDGEVRAMTNYEGTVGNLLTEPVPVLWQRAIDRWTHPVVVDAMSDVDTMADWAVATRRIDYYFGSDDVRDRIDRRPEFTAPISLSTP